MEKDPYKYFRIEAHELLEGLGRGLLELEKKGAEKDVVARLLRLAHTLKGAARVVKQGTMAEAVHAIEDALVPYRATAGPVPGPVINQMLALLDRLNSQLATLKTAPVPTANSHAAPQAVAANPIETMRVDLDEIDLLRNSVAEAGVQFNVLRDLIPGVESARQQAVGLLAALSTPEEDGTVANTPGRALAEELCRHLERLEPRLAAGIGHAEGELALVRDASNRLRLLPAGNAFVHLERAARDAAATLQKEVTFVAAGEHNKLDAHVLVALRDAFLHVVRNAVAHGIEAPAERVAAGKPRSGRIDLQVQRRGDWMAFVCRDDGRGIDLPAIRRAAAQRGLLPPAEAAVLSCADAIQLILQGGLSTASSVDEVSGRGVGLDVARDAAAQFKGTLNVQSEAGRGTTVELCVPISLSALASLELDAGGTRVALPLDAVRKTLRISEADLVQTADSESIVYNGEAIPFVALATALRCGSAPSLPGQSWATVVLEAASGVAAVGADRLVGTAHLVVQPLPALAAAESLVAGATLDMEGNPQLLLSPDGLVKAAHLGAGRQAAASPAIRPPILVIDDSLTTRMLEQSILESAGYEVDTATSAEEGWTKAKQRTYGLFLVDVEMPGMDGFEFVARTRADPVLRVIPAILVTSRNSSEDRRRGVQVGARAHIIKAEFHQGQLLQLIRECIG